MVTKGNPGDNRGGRSSSGSMLAVAGLCCCFYLLAVWQRSGFGKGDSIALEITKKAEDCDVLKNLEIETHATDQTGEEEGESPAEVRRFEACGERYVDYTPCQDQVLAMTFPRAPKGYVTPFPWPKSRDYVPFANAPHKSLSVEKAVQNWVQYEGNVLRFPGGGTQFPQGADAYIKQLASVIPIDNGIVRTALDTGCGVSS
nr:probable methyltransferase PMT2 [Ipomoea batatas]